MGIGKLHESFGGNIIYYGRIIIYSLCPKLLEYFNVPD
jgi:hypothetical protein